MNVVVETTTLVKFMKYDQLLQNHGVLFNFTMRLPVIATFRPFASIGQTTCILSPIGTITPDFSPFEYATLPTEWS